MKQSRNFKQVFLVILTLLMLPQIVHAGIEWKTLREVKLANQALDVTASFDGKLIFSLTPGAILVYSTDDDRFTDRIPVDTRYTRIAYANEERLILSAADPATHKVIKFDQVYDINITNRHFKGAADAKVTLVVFDDYQ
jgi:hypothetical protein